MRLDALRIAAPCDADWQAMPGDARARHCDRCDTRVVDLSAGTRAEAEAALARPGALCVRVTRDAAGVVTRTTHQERLVGLLQALARRKAEAP